MFLPGSSISNALKGVAIQSRRILITHDVLHTYCPNGTGSSYGEPHHELEMLVSLEIWVRKS
jgi:hypothetical protein